jgi:hypothetical protein
MELKDLLDLGGRLTPGALGSLFSMLLTTDGYPRKIVSFFGGVAAAYYATSYTIRVTGFNEGLSGFLLGFFGMAVLNSFMDTWKKFDLTSVIRQLLRLPPKETP